MKGGKNENASIAAHENVPIYFKKYISVIFINMLCLNKNKCCGSAEILLTPDQNRNLYGELPKINSESFLNSNSSIYIWNNENSDQSVHPSALRFFKAHTHCTIVHSQIRLHLRDQPDKGLH